jgi:hypothetical protein
MTATPPIDQAKRLTGGPQPDPPPLPWWSPAVVFAVAAVVLSVLVIAFGTNNGPLDDPNQAFQRDGALHNGSQLPARIGDVDFGESSVVVLFVRRQPPGQTLAKWSAGVTRTGSRVVVAVAGRPGTSGLREALGMRSPIDGGPPVGYAIVDKSGRVRYATLDPAYLDHSSEVELLTAALSGHAS